MSPIVYCWDEEGYTSHVEECTVDPLESVKAGKPIYVLPTRGCLEKPELVPGKIARRVDGAWIQEENHKGKTGFINRMPHTIDKYGPLPDGWSETLPPLTEDELFAQLRMLRDGRLSENDAKIAKVTRQGRNGEDVSSILLTLDAYADALCNLPAQEGAPWDGGGELTPWPELPSVG